MFQRNVSVARGLTDAVGTPRSQIALPDADIHAAESPRICIRRRCRCRPTATGKWKKWKLSATPPILGKELAASRARVLAAHDAIAQGTNHGLKDHE